MYSECVLNLGGPCPGVTIYGITDPARFDQRAPTVAFTLDGYTPRQVAERLGRESIFVWDGNYYALAVTERLGVEESGGMVRVGIAHHNTAAEVIGCWPWSRSWLGSNIAPHSPRKTGNPAVN